MYEVSSEIYAETDFQPVTSENGKIISKFKFTYPKDDQQKDLKVDKDGDLEVERRKTGLIEIEHVGSTVLQLVGLQVWRGALLLADFIFHNRNNFKDKNILELGAGVGLTSIAAAIYCRKVICTDIDIGGILDFIKCNIIRNKSILKNNVDVMELDFKQSNFSKELTTALDEINIVIAADVIYDDDLTDSFINVLDNLLNEKKFKKRKLIYVALEKRYVFTIENLDTSAPCFDYFLQKSADKPWKIKYIPINFPQYFEYERCKELVLLEIIN